MSFRSLVEVQGMADQVFAFEDNIVGTEWHVAVSVDITRWRLFAHLRHTIAIGIGPVIVWPRFEYADREWGGK